MDNPANSFVDARSSQEIEVDYARVAQQIVALKPRALMPQQFDDVLTLIEWMQERCVEQHTTNELKARELDAREEALAKREKALVLRGRTVELAMRATVKPPAKGLVARYLKG